MTLEDFNRLTELKRRLDFYKALKEDLENGVRVSILGQKISDRCEISADQEILNAFKCLADDQYALYKYQFDRVLLQTPRDYYRPACPLGHDDCVNDPARIKRFHPEYYKDLYGDLSISMAVKECCTTEKCYYDNIVE